MRRFFMMAMIAETALLAAACSIPMRHERVDHVMAVGWDRDNRPLALGQEIKFGEHFIIVGPDGALEVNQQVKHGPLVLISQNERKRLSPKPLRNCDSRNCRLETARWSGDDQRFLALVSVHVGLIETDEYGFNVNANGDFEQFYLAERHANYEISPDGRELNRMWYRKDNEGVFRYCVVERIDASTGEITDLPLPLGKTQLRINNLASGPDRLPCRPDLSCLSPDGNRLIMSCLEEDSCSIWLMDSIGQANRVMLVPAVHQEMRAAEMNIEELKARYLYTSHTLAWSPDQGRVYFCQGPGADGYVIDLASGEIISRSPGLLAANWSPDGTSLAGIVDGKLIIWCPDELGE